MPKKRIFLFLSLTLLNFFFQASAFAASTSISISSNRGLADLSAGATFDVDPVTGKTGGSVTITIDGTSYYHANPTTSSWNYSSKYDTNNLLDGSHIFAITVTSWNGSIASS